METNSISLSELAGRIEQTVRMNFGKPVWVRAEIGELRVNGGHCYMELVEKAAGGDGFAAKCRAACWAATWRMLRPYFEQTTGQELRAGLQVLVAVTVDFHGVYGLTLNVRDIDPVFTVGEMAARRLQIVRRLEQEGVADMNRQLSMPVPAQRVAVISSATAAGYGDFCNQLAGNVWGYVFYTRLFPAVMQGDGAAASVITALEEVFERADRFDAVVIIRGGGATADLAAFDSYDLALNVAQFPLPVIAGIGHQRDVSILDTVAHTSVKTPTAAAEYLVDNVRRAEQRVEAAFDGVWRAVQGAVERERRTMERAALRVRHALRVGSERRTFAVEQWRGRLRTAVGRAVEREENRLRLLEKTVQTHSPAYLLERGYTLTTLHGRRLTSAHGVQPGDRLRTYFPDGVVESVVDADRAERDR